MKIDPYNNKERYLSWKESVKKGIPNLSDENSKFILDYIIDMELGLNVASASKKGARSYNRLNNLRQKMIFMAKEFKNRYDIEDLSKYRHSNRS